MSGFWLLLPILLPVAAGCAAFFARSRRILHRSLVLLLGSELLLVLALGLLCTEPVTFFRATASLSFTLQADGISLLFGLIATAAWLGAGIFAMRYMDHAPHSFRFFAFFQLTLSALLVICFAGNLATLYLGYEAMTLLSLPMVLHTGTKQARNAGVKYLGFSVLGAALGLFGLFFLQQFGGAAQFVPGGVLDLAKLAGHENELFVLYLILCVGFGCKAGLYPLHGWLPTAHPVAPAPASAVLSGVITKMGVLAIVRVTFFLIGPQLLSGSWAQAALLVLSLVTVFLGSMLAYREKLLKKRLAWSTVSQVSYVLFGIFLLNEVALQGALLQLVFHAVAKNGLFLAAGAIIFVTGRTRTDQMQGVGLQLPWILAGFTVCALSLIGIPPLAGFWSKWDLILGALDAPVFTGIAFAGVIVLLVSAILTAGYLLPIVRDAYFPGARFRKPERMPAGGCLTGPVLGYALLLIVLGLVPGLCGTVAGLLGAGLF